MTPDFGPEEDAKTAVHELGHEFGLGEIDDNEGQFSKFTGRPEEVYSGTNEDDSWEEVINTSSGLARPQWSVMSSGTTPGQYIPPTNDDYVAFSIEELLALNKD